MQQIVFFADQALVDSNLVSECKQFEPMHPTNFLWYDGGSNEDSCCGLNPIFCGFKLARIALVWLMLSKWKCRRSSGW